VRVRLAVAAPIVVVLAVTSCAVAPAVEAEQSNASAGPLLGDGPAVNPNAPSSGSAGPTPAPAASIAWTPCAGDDMPDPESLGSTQWECATLTTAMDPFGDAGGDARGEAGGEAGDATIDLALTRHPATGDRVGTIVLNPGGPGGSGLDAAWGLRPLLPVALLRSFDIVAWDPRGVGRSTPAIACAPGADQSDIDFIEECAARTGDLSAYLSAPYSVADMEAIRIALGEDRLDYLGYSYGTLLGAGYAAQYPSTVGSFVLDGATDPLVGSGEGPFIDGFATFADDGFPAARARFVELCDASYACLGTADTESVLDELHTSIDSLPTDDAVNGPAQVDAVAFEGLLNSALTSAAGWEFVATALGDALNGDASAAAAMIAGVPELDAQTDSDGSNDLGAIGAANSMIYCADFADLISESPFCDALPDNARRLSPVESVDVAQPVLVIGTDFDPLTPGKHAPDFAAALGDATHLVWEGVGHTVFPGWTNCIDDEVTAQFLGKTIASDGTRCAFLDGAIDDVQIADDLFGFTVAEAQVWVADAISEFYSEYVDPQCLARQIVANDDADDRVISHLILDVTSAAAEQAIAAAATKC
jgi:pimeloyl-ACP methyl ester carboxylesterase